LLQTTKERQRGILPDNSLSETSIFMLMKKRALLSLVLFSWLTSSMAFSQDSSTKQRFQKTFKVSYVGNFNSVKFDYESLSFFRRYDEYDPYTAPIRNLSLALQFTNSRGNFHEVEVSHLIHGTASTSPLWLQPRSTGLKYRQLSWRYERAFCLLSRSRLKFFAGYGLMETIRYRADGFDGPGGARITELRVYFTRAYIVPRLTFQISKKLGMDLNLPIEIIEQSIAFYKVRQFGTLWSSPSSLHTNLENTIGHFQVRFGLQYRI